MKFHVLNIPNKQFRERVQLKVYILELCEFGGADRCLRSLIYYSLHLLLIFWF